MDGYTNGKDHTKAGLAQCYQRLNDTIQHSRYNCVQQWLTFPRIILYVTLYLFGSEDINDGCIPITDKWAI